MCISWMRAVVREGTISSGSARPGERAAVAAGQSRGAEAELARRLERADHVWAPPGGADTDGEIAWPPERPQLAREDLIESEVVADRGERGGVGGERDRGNGRAVADVAHGELGREVLRVRGTAAIAEEHQLAAAFERLSPPLPPG